MPPRRLVASLRDGPAVHLGQQRSALRRGSRIFARPGEARNERHILDLYEVETVGMRE
jgi:hypothetical protein